MISTIATSSTIAPTSNNRRFDDLNHLARRQDVKLDKFDTFGVLAHKIVLFANIPSSKINIKILILSAKLAFAKQYVRRELSSCIARERAFCMLSRFRHHSSLADADLRHAADAALGDLRSEPDLSPWIGGD